VDPGTHCPGRREDRDTPAPVRAQPGARTGDDADTAAPAEPADQVTVEEAAVPLDAVAAALADARSIVSKSPRRWVRRDRDGARQTRADNLRGRGGRGGYSGPRPDDRDPQRLGSVLSGYVDERGWDRPLAQARVFTDWAALVGSDVAAHCTPQSLAEGELRIAAESTAWATQLRLLSATLLSRLVAELGPDVVTKLRIGGPSAPSWKHGNRSVRGSRGPRDTYG
jgi:predicted nucleic acid-binding Zn ribbon protein